MNVSGMTLEGFFLADYERLRKENEELKAKLGEATPSGFGVFDLGHPTEMVKVSVPSYGNYMDKEGITSDVLRQVASMDDSDLWEWARKEYESKSTWYSALRPITVEYHKFQYTLRIVETRHDRTFVTDGKESDGDEGRLFRVKDWEGEECLEVWQDTSRLDYIKRQALEQLRYVIETAIPNVERREQQ